VNNENETVVVVVAVESTAEALHKQQHPVVEGRGDRDRAPFRRPHRRHPTPPHRDRAPVDRRQPPRRRPSRAGEGGQGDDQAEGVRPAERRPRQQASAEDQGNRTSGGFGEASARGDGRRGACTEAGPASEGPGRGVRRVLRGALRAAPRGDQEQDVFDHLDDGGHRAESSVI
jgi:hypothetical protein